MPSLTSYSQEPIFATASGGGLYSFDLTNCTRSFKGSTGFGFEDIAFTPDGRLWGIIAGQLHQIDTTTANTTFVGNIGFLAVSLVGLNDSTLLAESGLKLYEINNNNASSFYIDTIGYQASGDLTWYDDDLYMVTSSGQIIRITLNATFTSILNVTPIGSSIPYCQGAITASFSGDYNSIVGFNGPNLIKICQIDGSVQSLCPSLNIGGTPGAASIRLPTQEPQPSVCQAPNSVEFNQIDLDLYIYPNPTSTHFKIEGLNKPYNLAIYNVVGQLLYTQNNILEANKKIEVSTYPKGLLFIRIESEDKVYYYQIIKQ